MGADCILLIVAALELAGHAGAGSAGAGTADGGAGESHNAEELSHAALHAADALQGINNRNLRTFEVSLDTTLALLPKIGSEAHRRHRIRHPRAGGRRGDAQPSGQRLSGR